MECGQTSALAGLYHDVAGPELEGHADDRGSAAYNLALGARRAKAVRDYLIGKGVDPKRLRIVSAGKDRPVAAGHTHDARAKNRVVIIKPFGKNVSRRDNAAVSAGL
jgi:outer membrane protein OmpA-like peptidoglycan-associated protein